MEKKIKVAVIGLDTSHAVEFPKLMQDPNVPAANQIHDLVTTRCIRFETPFQNKDGLDKRQAYLESIGVMVTEDFDTAVADCDAVMIEINDPARHLEYFEKCAKLGKPVFLDKPMADTLDNALKMLEIAKENNIRFFTASALRFDVDFVEGIAKGVKPESAVVWGPVGKAPAGSSIIWYGVHAFEMLQRIMGRGAVGVTVIPDRKGYVCNVAYNDGRRGIVELAYGAYRYGAVIRDNVAKETLIQVSCRVPFYQMLITEIVKFFKGEDQVVPLEDSIEIMSMLAAADRSASTGRNEPVYIK